MLFTFQDSNLPAGFDESEYTPKQKRKPVPEPLTDAEREEMARQFAIIDEYDKRNKGQQFDNE